jgi:isoamylase
VVEVAKDFRAGDKLVIGRGQSYPPGSKISRDGTNFSLYSRAAAVPLDYSGAAGAPAMKSVTIDSRDYDWDGDRPLQRPASRTVIYEMHVRGFTRHPNSGVAENLRGTYGGVVEKIPYLQQLGITAVELLPVFQFDSHDAPPGLKNYWGYAPVSFFAPHRAYSSRHDAAGPVHEFRDMAKALHRAGIEVILDVVSTIPPRETTQAQLSASAESTTALTTCWAPTVRATPITAVPETR